jgi:hypothetical protein
MRFPVQVRVKSLELLSAAITQAGATKTSSKDTPVQSGKGPAIIVYTDDHKQGLGSAPPTFRTTVLLSIELIAEGKTKDDAEALCDSLCEIAENTLLGTPAFVKLFEMITEVDTRTEYRGENSRLHTAAAVMELKGYCTEIFEPSLTVDLTGINVYVDSVNVFDPAGNYPGEIPFDVSDAPRDRGPDGRPEISGSVDMHRTVTTEDGDAITTEDGAKIVT